MAEFTRPQFRFVNRGMKLNAPPDALAEDKYGYLENVRSYKDSTIGSRPPVGVVSIAPSSPNPMLALEPTIGVFKVNDTIYENKTGISPTALDAGYSVGKGASIIPFRPNASPNAWDYVFDASKSSKVYIPSSGSPIVKNTGCVEPQLPPDAAVNNQAASIINMGAVWTPGGTATSSVNGNRVTDSVGVVFPDPASAGNKQSFTVSPSQSYSRGMVINIAGQLVIVDDVFPNLTTPLSIKAIYYFTGSTGRCVVVPNNLGTEEPSLYDQLYLSLIRRGAIVAIGAELCFVLSSSVGPDGSICFETSTVATHTTADMLLIADAISVVGSGITSGQAISSPLKSITASPGIATWTSSLALNPFVNANSSFQPDDYIHISVRHGDLLSINEMKILFDIGDGTFTQDFYYYTIRPSDLRDAINNIQTQIGAAQIALQRQIIDEELVALAHNQGRTVSGAQTGPGNDEWSEIIFPIRMLTRVGDSENKTLQNVNAIQVLYNVGGVGLFAPSAFNSITVVGGFQPDVGFGGSPYQYWLVPRDSTTGAQGNPSPAMRYGVSPRRQQVNVPIPATYPDPQVDTWDVYRMGGSVTEERYAGSVPLGTTVFLDNYSDATVIGGRLMARDNYQPFPSIGPPIQGMITKAQTLIGTVGVFLFDLPAYNPAAAATLNQLANLLPGNEINVGQQIFTLWTRPTITPLGDSQICLCRFVENAGFLVNPIVKINEPALAAQNLHCVWGPDSNGVLFGVQDPLRPGVVNHTNPNNPDGASDSYTDDICAPTEPLQNGVLLDQTSIVFSTKRAWAGYPQQGGSGYRWVEIPVGDGLAAEFGICTDGKSIYYIGHHGIMMTSGGPAKSLTDDDLYDLFPHEGLIFDLPAFIATPAGNVYRPDYSRNSQMRLAVVNGYLYFDYQDQSGNYRTLVCDLRTVAWNVDSSLIHPYTIHAGATLTGDQLQLYIGDTTGAVYAEDQFNPGTGETVSCSVLTREHMNDLRATSMFGDASLDCLPASALTVTPVFLNVLFGTASTVAVGARVTEVVDLLGQQIKRSAGLLVQWSDQGVTSLLYGWGCSLVPQPEDIQNRYGDWDDCGRPGAKFIQGFILECDTFNAIKQLSIRSADDLTVKQSFQVQHNGQSEKAYTFTTPFIAHLIRDEPDSVPWRRFGIRWIFEPTPETVYDWVTQSTAHGLPAYQHAKEMLFAYNASQPVNFTVTVDGIPYTYALPATSGYEKALIRFQPVKGLVFQYRATSSQRFQVWQEDIEIKIRAWGDPGPYLNWQKFGAIMGPEARI